MHHALLKIQYVLPPNHFCYEIRTIMRNSNPHDLTKLSMMYDVSIFAGEESPDCMHVPIANSLEDLIEECRKWSMEKRKKDEQSVVHKSREGIIPNERI